MDTAGCTEQGLGAARVKHQPLFLLSKLTALSVNTASVACVSDLLIASTTTGSRSFIFLFIIFPTYALSIQSVLSPRVENQFKKRN